MTTIATTPKLASKSASLRTSCADDELDVVTGGVVISIIGILVG